MSIERNRDLSARLAGLITSTGIERVTDQQPVRWRHAAWHTTGRNTSCPNLRC